MNKDCGLLNAESAQNAYAYVTNGLKRRLWSNGEQLPSVRQLASAVQVSSPTMLKALAVLKAENLIHGVKRSRLRAGPAGSIHVPHATLSGAYWQSKRIEIEKDILSGVYTAQPWLPSAKELENRYGISYRTLRKIVKAMVSDGVLKVRANRYELNHSFAAKGLNRIVFLTGATLTYHVSALNQGQYRILDCLEAECSRRLLNLDVVLIDFYNLAHARRALASAQAGRHALGYIFDFWQDPQGALFSSTIEPMLRLSSSNIPTAILDEAGTFDLPVQPKANPLLQVFRIEGKKAGARVARSLLDLGHRSVVYLSSVHESLWSIVRFEGIKEQFALAGLAGKAHEATSNSFGKSLELLLTISGFDNRLIRRILDAGRTKSQARDALNSIIKFSESNTSLDVNCAAYLPAKRDLAPIAALSNLSMEEDLFDALTVKSIDSAGTKLAAITLGPLFEKALSFGGATAWICANDGMAFQALSFLQKRHIEVPGHLSVIGFDNTPTKAFAERLSSFDFNAPAFAGQMLNFITRPPARRGAYRHEAIEVAGQVLLRDTTRKVNR
jgi:DNA-binding transcriptional regulator YhcF (GntR family)